MGMISNGKVTILGNFEKPKRYKHGRPKDAFMRDYKAIVPYDFEWRATLGKVTCTCTECIEAYQPYYGFDWYHMDDCAIIQHLKRYPQMENLLGYDPRRIATSE